MRTLWGLVGAIATAMLIAHGASAKDLGDILLKKGLITEDELKQAREEDKQKAAADESRRDAIMAKLPKWLDVITPFGDLRTRYEGFFQENRVGESRFRLRARVGLTAAPTDEISATVRLATGDPNNPVTRNQTFQNDFTQKAINLDQAYLTFRPSKIFNIEPGWITMTGGKFSVNAYRVSELVWDDDLTPEGFSQSLNLVEQREGFLRGLKLNTFEWIVNEVSHGFDPWMGGGQIVSETALGSIANLTAAFADYHYSNLKEVAKDFLNPMGSSFNKQLATTNCLAITRDGMGKLQSINNFCSGFNIVNGSADLDFPNVLGIPAGVFGDIAYNTQAPTRNTGFYVGAGIGRSGKDYYHDTLKNAGDWGISYTYVWVERDATLALFTYDDMAYSQGTTVPFNQTQTGSTVAGGTNVTGHIVKFDYMPISFLQLTWKTHFINALDDNLNQANSVIKWQGNPTLVRTQVDAMLKF